MPKRIPVAIISPLKALGSLFAGSLNAQNPMRKFGAASTVKIREAQWVSVISLVPCGK